MLEKRIPVGYEDFKRVISMDMYYVDKTLMIKELLDRGASVNLFTRPRRFGKTLNLSMLRRFFERELDDKGNAIDNGKLFKSLNISACGESYMSHQGKYPVINLSLKSAKQPDFPMAYNALVNEIIEEYKRHYYLLASRDMIEADRKRYYAIINREAEAIDYATALEFLSTCLARYHKENVIILIDEYDIPLVNAYLVGFYDKMAAFIRSLLESALKTNENLEFAVITGCLRISKESIFTGLNNLKAISILTERYSEYFGFTQTEVSEMLSAYGLEDKEAEVKQWYDGYLFGNTEVYNPWSVINYVDEAAEGGTKSPKPYWSNTSSNSIIRELIERADVSAKLDIEKLMRGESLDKQVHEDITYEDIYKTQDNLWNFLYFTGYLKAVQVKFDGECSYVTLTIPNEEVRYIYRSTIQEWFEQKLKNEDFEAFHQAVVSGNSEAFEWEIKAQLRECISYFDSAESFYHGFLLGLLSGFPGYMVRSNREFGDGRPDIVLIPLDEKNPVVIIECKHAQTFRDMEAQCDAALKQIEDRKYPEEFLQEGYDTILQYGIGFCKKSCKVKSSAMNV